VGIETTVVARSRAALGLCWLMMVVTQIPSLKLDPTWEGGSQKGQENSLSSPCFTSQVHQALGRAETLLRLSFSYSEETFPQAFFSLRLRIKQSDVDELCAEMHAMICGSLQFCLYFPGRPRRGGIHKRDRGVVLKTK